MRRSVGSAAGRLARLGARRPFSRTHNTPDQLSALHQSWVREFKSETVDLAAMDSGNISYDQSANRLRALLKTALLKHTDIRDEPERFFLAHRVLAGFASRLGPGFWIRFTVHYNLCAGTVVALGSDEQIASLEAMHEDELLGCFALTEKLAGVNSGLVVNTRADYDPNTETFTLWSPDSGATKNWISQGLVADKAVVVADLRLDGKSHGPHAFFIDMRRDGELCPGIVVGDMGKKSVGNDLDNAWIAFDRVKVPKAALLSRYCSIEDGNYVQKVKGLPVFHMIGQRLFTGRVAVAQAALEFRRHVFGQTLSFCEKKDCWTPKGTRPLASLPQLRRLFEEDAANQAKLDRYAQWCEAELCKHLKAGTAPPVELVEAIAIAKVKCVEDSIHFVHRLQNEVGSYALMHGTGFEQRDFLTCCKFAEGDSRILMQKLARDHVKLHQKGAAPADPTEAALCEAVAAAKDEDALHDATYALAEHIIESSVERVVSSC